jgi:hypothetical protein
MLICAGKKELKVLSFETRKYISIDLIIYHIYGIEKMVM